MKRLIFKSILFIWNLLPFKKELSFVIKKIKLKNKLYKDLRYRGIMNLEVNGKPIKLYNPGFTTIENEIFWNGLDDGWEKISLNLWKELVIHSKVILDIGANSGIYSMVASVLNTGAEIYSFEPVKRTAELFKTNIKINKTKNISFFELAVSNISGSATFFDVTSKSQYSASLNPDILSNHDNRISYSVEVIKLDEFMNLKGKKVDLIKLDVEMHEPEAVEGMLDIIRRDKPTILIEILSEEIGFKINSLIGDLNYHFYTIDEENIPKKIPSVQQSEFHNILMIQENILIELGLNTD